LFLADPNLFNGSIFIELNLTDKKWMNGWTPQYLPIISLVLSDWLWKTIHTPRRIPTYCTLPSDTLR